LADWQKDRLKGRTIVILTRAPEANDSLTSELSSLVAQSGGVPVIVRINSSEGFNLADEALANDLKQLILEVDGEDYEVTLAQALAHEWSFSIQESQTSVESDAGDESGTDGTDGTDGTGDADQEDAESDESLSTIFEGNYPLTELLVQQKRITVTTAYQPLLQKTDMDELPEATMFARQRSAYELAERLHLPYNASGVIDTAVAVSENEPVVADSVALQIALAFDKKGTAKELSYRHPPASAPAQATNPTDSAQDGLTANYYAVLAQQEEPADTMLSLSRDIGLSCELSPLDPLGRYGIIALLSGAEKGTYGLNRNGVDPFPSIPQDN
jgi:hypothetical protein